MLAIWGVTHVFMAHIYTYYQGRTGEEIWVLLELSNVSLGIEVENCNSAGTIVCTGLVKGWEDFLKRI